MKIKNIEGKNHGILAWWLIDSRERRGRTKCQNPNLEKSYRRRGAYVSK